MGKVKIKKKSTFIDMTAMSDVTVLLLTFFMLTSTFLQKEPTVVITPSSVSEEKVPVANLVTILVSAADQGAKDGVKPTDSEGKIFLSFAGDSILSTSDFRMKVLENAVALYNDQHKNATIALDSTMLKAFAETNMMGTSFKDLPTVLKMSVTERDKLMGGLGLKDNPNGLTVGIPINGNKNKDGDYNDFQIWCRAIYDVASDTHKNYKESKSLSEDDAKKLEDFYNALTKDGKGIAVKADKDTPFGVIQLVFDNLQTMKLNKFSLLTALTSEDEAVSTPKE